MQQKKSKIQLMAIEKKGENVFELNGTKEEKKS